MSFGKLKRRLQALINRKDVTDQIAGDFITDAVADLERQVRIGPMETILEQSAWPEGRNAMVIPNNFIESINLFTDSSELVQVDLGEFLAMPDVGGTPTVFAKIAGRFLLRPTPQDGLKVYLHYYRQLTGLASDEDKNVWTDACFNAVLYTAAGLAADFYQMEDSVAARFAGRASGYVQAIASQDLDEKWSGRLAISPPQDLGDY